MDATTLAAVLGWGALVGLVFSAIGAAGGILTSFGLITLFAVADPNAVKPMTQIVVLATALVYVPGYLRRGAIVPALGLLLGLGGVVGAWAGSTVSSRLPRRHGHLPAAVRAAHPRGRRPDRLEAVAPCAGAPGGHRGADAALSRRGHRQGAADGHCMCFTYEGHRYRVPVISPLIAGALIAFTAALFGVGGGFLLVPYMASVLAMPMHIIPATTAIPIFMSLAVSVGNFMSRGAAIDWGLLAPLVAGAVLGAVLGPQINKALPNAALQAAMGVIVAGIGVKYLFF
jgi:uncharacterized membrane protein YfcA